MRLRVTQNALQLKLQLMLEFLKAPFLVLHFSYYTLMTFLMMLSTLCSKCGQASDVWQQPDLTSKL